MADDSYRDGWQPLVISVQARADAAGVTQNDAFSSLLDDLNEGRGIGRIVAFEPYEGGPFKPAPPTPIEVEPARLDPSFFVGFEPNLKRFNPVRRWPPHCSFRFEVSGALLPRDISKLLDALVVPRTTRRKKKSPEVGRAKIAFNKLYPNGDPGSTIVRDNVLFDQINDWLVAKELASVKIDAAMRAAGRRKDPG
jgi:hypothetical protein